MTKKKAFKAQLKEMLKEYLTVEISTEASWYQEDTGWAATHLLINAKVFFDGEEISSSWSGVDVPD